MEGTTGREAGLLPALMSILMDVPNLIVKVVDGETHVRWTQPNKTNTVLDEGRMFVLNGSHTGNIRHPRNKVHHRNFDATLPTLLREKKVKEEKEKEIKMSQSILKRPSREIHHGNFEEGNEGKERKISQSIPNRLSKEIHHRNLKEENKEGKERKTMKSTAKTDHGERKARKTMNSTLSSSHLRETADNEKRNTNRTINLENWEQGNNTDIVRMIRLTSLDLELPVLLAFISLISIAVVSVMYACYFCIVCLQKREQKKSQLFTLT